MIDQQLKLKARIEKVLGLTIGKWDVGRTSVTFRITDDVSLNTLTILSTELGTDKINFNFGYSGSPGYSEYTPSSPGEPGYIQIYLDGIKEEEDAAL